MVQFNLKVGTISDDKKGLFGKKSIKTTIKRRSQNKRKNGTKTKGHNGGSMWSKISDKIKSIMPKRNITTSDEVLYKVKRNASNTADVFSIVKNGKEINSKEIPDSTSDGIIKTVMNNIKSYFTKFYKKDKTDKKVGGNCNCDNSNDKDDSSIGGNNDGNVDIGLLIGGAGGQLSFPNKIDISEDSHLYNVIYKRRAWFDIFGRILLHLIFFFLFGLFYIIFVFGYTLYKNELPLNFYKKFFIINGREVEV